MTIQNVFNIVGFMGFVIAITTVISVFYYMRHLSVWHNHLVEWSSFLTKHGQIFDDKLKEKSVEIKDKL